MNNTKFKMLKNSFLLRFLTIILTFLFNQCEGPAVPEVHWTQPHEIPIPKLISPKNGAVLDNGCTGGQDIIEWDFEWTDVGGNSFYKLYVIGPHATKPLIKITTTWQIDKTSYHYESTDYIIDRNRLNWKWRVRAGYWEGDITVHMWEVWGPWSEWRYFDVEPLNTDCPSN